MLIDLHANLFTPGMLMYWAGDFGNDYARICNDEMSAYCAQDPAHFAFWAHANLAEPAEAAREIERATTPDAWGDVAHDLDRVGVTQDDRALARSTARAVRLLASGDLDGAVAELADFCGLTPAEWERVTRAEQGR